MMPTTIQINEETLELLKKVKHQTKAQTYDEVIQNFMKLSEYARTFRGFIGKKKSRDLMHGLRDKKDRF